MPNRLLEEKKKKPCKQQNPETAVAMKSFLHNPKILTPLPDIFWDILWQMRSSCGTDTHVPATGETGTMQILPLRCVHISHASVWSLPSGIKRTFSPVHHQPQFPHCKKAVCSRNTDSNRQIISKEKEQDG